MLKNCFALFIYLSSCLLLAASNEGNKQAQPQLTPQLPQLLVGYIQPQFDIKMSTAVAEGYDILVLAFGNIEADHVSMSRTNCDGFPEGCFVAYLNQQGDDWLSGFKADLSLLHQQGKQVLLSFGSGDAVNTFQPVDPATGYNVDHQLLANNLIHYTQNILGIDGIDFDLEIMSGDEFSGSQRCCEIKGSNACFYDENNGPNALMQACRQTYLVDLISAIKRKAPRMRISAAPQININNDQSALKLVNTAQQTVFQGAIEADLFDYIFAQAYNTPEFTVNADCQLAKTENSSDLYTELYPEFISLVYPCIEVLLAEDSRTRLYIGQLANSGNGAITYGSYDEIAQQYAKLMRAGYANFAGAMAWSVNTDATTTDDKDNKDTDLTQRQAYSFAHAVKPSLRQAQKQP